MKSKQSNLKKFFVPYPQQSGPPRSQGDETDIDMAVDTPASTPVANKSSPRVQTGGLNVSTPHIQTGGSNVSMPCGQDIGTLTTRPNIESATIPYGDNQPADPNLWDGSFSSISLFGTEESIDKDVKNLAITLQRIRTYIKQHPFNPEDSAPLDFEPVISSIWQLINTIYESG